VFIYLMRVSKIQEDAFVSVSKSTTQVHMPSFKLLILVWRTIISKSKPCHNRLEFQFTANLNVERAFVCGINIIVYTFVIGFIIGVFSGRKFRPSIIHVFTVRSKKSFLLGDIFYTPQDIRSTQQKFPWRHKIILVLRSA